MGRKPAPRLHTDFLRREIQRIRIEQEMSIEELARQAGYAQHGHLARWLAGTPGVDLPLSRVAKILDILGYELSYTNKA